MMSGVIPSPVNGRSEIYICHYRLRGGGGGGGFSPDFCKNTILRYELAMMARTCTNNLRVVFSPYEASEQKWSQKTNI